MNHHHRKVLHALFAHPVSANLAWGSVGGDAFAVPALCQAIAVAVHFQDIDVVGQAVEEYSGKLHVTLNGKSANFSHAKHSLPKEEVIQVRKFMESCGIDPERDYPL